MSKFENWKARIVPSLTGHNPESRCRLISQAADEAARVGMLSAEDYEKAHTWATREYWKDK